MVLPVWSAPVSVTYRCRLGQAPARIESPAAALAPEVLERLRTWDSFAVTAIARAVKGETRLQEALPLFETLLRAGPYAGYFGAGEKPADPFGPARAGRFLDAAARLAAGPPVPLLRELLGDDALVTELRKDTSSAARRAAEYVFTHMLQGQGVAEGCGRFLPLLVAARDHLFDPDLVQRCLLQITQGTTSREIADFLGQTFLWDVDLWLMTRPSAQDLAAALKLSDQELAQDFVQRCAAQHLRYFVLGPRESEGAALRWQEFKAEEFIAAHPDFTWVAHAAALAREIQRGTLLTVTAEANPPLLGGTETAPVEVTVRPAEGSTYALPLLVWPRSKDKTYDGLRCLEDTSVVRLPAPLTGDPVPCGLRYLLAFQRKGSFSLSFQYEICGLTLPTVSHLIEVGEPTSSGQAPGRPGPVPVTVEVTAPPPGYVPIAGGPPQTPGGPMTINGGRRIIELADGEHALEHTIIYQVRAATEDCFPGDITYCDPNPQGDAALVAQAVEAARKQVAEPLQGLFSQLPVPARVLGRECWVGRKGRGADGRFYYVLCCGTQQYYVRNPAYLFQKFWDPVLGENPAYDSTRFRDDVIAYAQAVLRALQVAGPGAAPQPGATTASPQQVSDYLKAARELLHEDENLLARIDLIVAAWLAHRLDNEAAAKTMHDDVQAAYDALAARASALQPPEPGLVPLHEGLTTTLAVGASSAGVLERAMAAGDGEKVNRATALLHSYEADRQQLRTRVLTYGLQLAPATGAPPTTAP
jgi:hypothetical protein